MAALLIMVPGVLPYAYAASAVNLSTASNYVVLAETTVTTTGTTSITGNVGLSPAAASFFTGFGQTLDASGQFSTSALVTGKLYAANYAVPTPAMLTTAVGDMQAAYTDAAGQASTASEGTTSLNGQTLSAGVYAWTSNLAMTGGITLSGSSSDVFIFQIPGTLTVSSGVTVNLSGGASASNVFWVVGGQTTLGTTAHFQGIILDKTGITMQTGASLTGRALAQTAVTLQGNTIAAPAASTSTSSTVPEFPTAALALIAMTALSVVGILSKRTSIFA